MAPPQPEAQTGMSLQQILAILGAHWKHSVYIVLAVIFLTAVVTKLMPKTYTAAATLIVSYDANDPLGGKEVPLGMLGSYVSTQIELMQSSEVLDPVIERLNLVSDPDYASGNKGGDATLRDWVETKLRKNLAVEPGHAGSQLIYVSASSDNADRAADIANAVADVYTEQQYNRMNGPASARAKRYTEELTDLKKKVAVAQDAVTQFRAHTGDIEGGSKADVDIDVLDALEHRLLEARNALRSNQARAAGKQDVSAPVLASETVRNLRAEDAKLKSHMAQLRTELGPNHPQVIELQSQIDANNSSLNAALATYSSAASSDIVVSSNEVAALEKALNAQRAKVMQVRQIRDQGAKYQLELESAQSVYKRALDGYDQIMFASTDHSSNVHIASRARPPVKAEKPNPVKYMLMGAVLGIVLGLLVPFGFELLNRRVRCRDDLERDFGIPVLIEFPAMEPALAPA
jgi:uncharacterized protein involved in exopolysaccharide biosynthesis